MRKLLYVLVGLVVLLIVAVFALPPLLGPSMIKPRVAEAVRDATGRELRIDGDFSLSLFPSVKLRASDVKFANAAGMTDAEMMTLGALELEIPLLPLIGKEVVVEKLVLREPVFSLERDAEGRANYQFEAAAAAATEAPAEEPAEPAAGLPISGLQLGEVRIEGGRVVFRDGATGRELNASGIQVSASLPDLQGVLLVVAEAIVNDQPLAFEVSVDSPGAAMSGQAIKLDTAMTSPLISLAYSGDVQQKPVPGLGGQFELDIDSVGQFLAWLEQPLPEGQPDPGPLRLTASFAADGQKATLEEARIEGEALQATATGSFDGSGEVKRVALQVESGVLDIDRYLPPAKAEPAEAAPKEGPPPSPQDILAGLSDEPIDLTPLRQTEADVKVALGGIRAKGYELGPVGLTVTLAGGVLVAELTELGLYGGNVSGRVGLDGAGEALAVEAQVKIDKAGVGELAKAATPEGPPPVAGVLSGNLDLTAQGASPKALAESARGKLALDLGGVKVDDARAAKLTELKLAAELQGLDGPRSLDAQLVYNAERVAVAVSLAPMGEVLAGGPFPLDVKLSSKPVKLGYAGNVQLQPVPGLDGQFDLDVGSVGKLLSWLDQPLPEGQPDPGPLKVTASFTADGEKATLEEARIEGKALQATAKGSFDGTGEVKRIALQVESGLLDIDSYLPPPKEKPAEATAPKPGPPPSPKDLLAGLSDEAIDLSALKQTEADVKVALGGIKVQGYELGAVGLTAKLSGGVLAAELTELGLYGGNVTGRVGLDAAGDALGVEALVNIDKAGIGELAKAATPEGPPPVSGVLSGVLEFASRGASPRKLAEGAKGRLELDLGGVEVQDERAGALSELKLALELPGLEAAPSLDAMLVYNGEPVSLDLDLAPIGQVLGGGAFPLEVKLASTHINAGYAGKAQQQPVPGLDGQFDLDIGSVGQLLAWLDQPLPEGQPDPGPLKVAARFAADGAKAALEEASIDGRAFKARAVGSFDSSVTPARFDADVTVEELDLNAYLPPQKEGEAAEKPAEAPAQQGWSEEPLDLAGLRQANGAVKIKTGPVKYLDLTIERSSLALTLENGVARITLDELALAGGLVTAAAMLDGSGEAAALDYQAKVDKVQAKPFLRTFSGIDWLSGTGNFEAKGTARGRSQKELVGTLNGDGGFQFLDGAIEGVNLAETLRNVGTLGVGEATGEVPRTDFTELSGSFTITNGLLDNQDLQMLAPLVRLDGAGQVPLPPQTVDYLLTAELVATLEGQGGESAEALSGLPIPIRLTGPWSNVGYEIDWQSAFQEAAKDPERLARMPGELSAKAKEFGVDLPLGGAAGAAGAAGLLEKATGDQGEAVGKALEQLPGATGEQGQGLGKLLEGVPGMPGAKKQEGEATATAPADQAPSPTDALKTLIQPGAEQPAAKQPAAEQPAAEQPAGEEPAAAAQPAAEQPAAQAPAAEAPAVPATEAPAAEEPGAKEKGTEEKALEGAGKAIKGLFGD